MAKQNLIARVLCWLGGDQYTRASTEAALQESWQAARRHIIRFDIHNDKWILLSDLHKGAKNGADDFHCFEDGDITGIEMSVGTIRLVRWPEDDGSPRRKVLQSGSLRKIFQALQH